MTYPKVSTTRLERAVPSSPTLPGDRGAGAGLLGGRRHLPGQRRAARRRRRRRQRVRLLRRPAVRQRPAALRPPAHRLRQGPDPALPDDARQARRAPLRLGHPRAARRARGDAPQRHQDHRRDRRDGHREVQRGLPRVGDEVHRRVARLRHPPGALGRLRQRLPHHEPRLHGVGDVGLQAAPRQGPGLRGLPGAALLLERRDAAVQPRAADGRRRLPEPPGPGGHRRLRHHHARRAPGAKLLVWTTTPWTLPSNLAVMVGDDIDYVVVERRRAPRYVLAEARLASYARELGRATPRSSGAAPAPTWSASPTRRRSPTTLGHENAFRVVAAEFVTTTDGTGLVHTAGAFGEDDKIVTDREGIEAVMPVGKDGRFTFPVDRLRGHAGLRRQPARSSTTSRPPPGASEAGSVTPGTVLLRRETYDHSYPHCWRCREPLIYKGVSSWFVEVTAIKERMLELNQQINWVPDHIQDGQFGRWLENARDWSITRNRFWGSPVPVWKSDDENYPRLDVYGSFEEIERDFGRLPHQQGRRDRPAPPVRRRPRAPEPRRPEVAGGGAVDDASRHRRPRRVVRLGLDELCPGALPVRERRVVRRHCRGEGALPGRLHRRVHRPDPRLVLHAAHPGHRDLRQAGLRQLHQPRHRARLRRQQDVEVAAQLPRRLRGLRPRRRRRDALVPDVEPDPARRQPRRHRAGDPRLGAPGDDPAVEQLVLLPALRQRRRPQRRGARRLGELARPLRAGQVPRSTSRR